VMTQGMCYTQRWWHRACVKLPRPTECHVNGILVAGTCNFFDVVQNVNNLYICVCVCVRVRARISG
jgi:hypothetical protein